MFRYEIGAHILLKCRDNPELEPIEVKILAKVPTRIKAEILSDGWFQRKSIHWLSDSNWFSVQRVGKEK